MISVTGMELPIYPKQTVSRIVCAVKSPEARTRLLALLKPMDNGPKEIQALDGLRALAALSIVAFHVLLFVQFEYQPISVAFNQDWYYLSTGVHLFFVLSGFLLFLPYARALLDGRPLPSARRFYRRRALRILPAYWVCLAVTVAVKSLIQGVPFSVGDVLAHILLINDAFPQYNRDYNGPFWTLAVEAQFYLLLPLIAIFIAFVVRKTRSPWRIAGGIGLLIAFALAVRLIDTRILASLPAGTQLNTSPAEMFVLATMGMQGKYLEVFAVGMLCALAYILASERRLLSQDELRSLAQLALVAAIICVALALPRINLAGSMVAPGAQWGMDFVTYPLLVGLGFGGLLLAILWGGRWLRRPFESGVMRTIGLISYSLYLWHSPIIRGNIPVFAGKPLAIVLPCVFLIAYLSYQLVERRFLKQRHREERTAETLIPQRSTPAVPGTEAERDERNAVLVR